MTQQSILITGCSTGIGLDAALTLHARGYQVFATARKQQDVEMLISKGLTAYRLDINDNDSIDIALTEILTETGGTLDFLFNNGAYGQPGAVEDLPTDALRAQFETNLFGWHELTKRIIPIMRQQGHGRIIQCSSVLGFVSLKYRGAYNASKYALEGLTDTMRLELKDANIQVSLIEPGPIDTQFRANALQAFNRYISVDDSVHEADYKEQIKRLSSENPGGSMTLPASAVTKALIHALESKRAKVRYRVTTPTKMFWLFKRILPSRWLDSLLSKG